MSALAKPRSFVMRRARGDPPDYGAALPTSPTSATDIVLPNGKKSITKFLGGVG